MNSSDFILAPFEHEGVPFDPAPHARANFEVAGARRHFLLKERDGVLFFRESQRAPIYAVPDAPRGERDPGVLSFTLEQALQRGDFGRFVSRHLWFPKVGGATVLCIIHRADRSGLIKEWFADEWRSFGALAPEKWLDLWELRPFLHYANRRAANSLLPKILQGTFQPPARRNLPKKWLRGDEDELERVILAALLLLEPRMGPQWADWGLTLSPHNAFSSGALSTNSQFWPGTPSFAPLTRRFMDLIAAHFAFCELKWRSHRVKPWKYANDYYDEKLIEAGNEEFGRDWRGNWYLDDSRHALQIPAYSAPSAHEKLEAALTLRQWLQTKIPAARATRLVRQAVDSSK